MQVLSQCLTYSGQTVTGLICFGMFQNSYNNTACNKFKADKYFKCLKQIQLTICIHRNFKYSIEVRRFILENKTNDYMHLYL